MATKNFKVENGLDVGPLTISTTTGNITGAGTIAANQITLTTYPTTDSIGEGATNKYFSNSLARGALNAGTGISYDSATGIITNTVTDTNTTYTQNATATTGGANLNLTGSDSTTDSVKFAGGTNITVSRTDADTITITNSAGVYTKEIHVSNPDGNDTTGDGTLLNPVRTITKALTLQTVDRLTIILHPGTYAESPTVTTNYTTIFATGLNGGNTQINGTLTVNATTRISGPIIDDLVIGSTANCYVTSCNIRNSVVKSGSGYVEILNSDMSSTFTGLTISGAGTVSIVAGKCWFPTVANASANVLIKDCYQVISPVVSAGALSIDGCVINAATAASNAVTTSAGTNITLANSFILNSAGSNVERVSLSGFYSILNLVYDRPNSTLIATSGTGGNLNAIDYFSVINADNAVVNKQITISGDATNGAGNLIVGSPNYSGSTDVSRRVFSTLALAATTAGGNGSTVTFTFSITQPRTPFAVGSKILVSGSNATGYNGIYTVTACSTTSVSYASTVTVAGSVSVALWDSTPIRGINLNNGGAINTDAFLSLRSYGALSSNAPGGQSIIQYEGSRGTDIVALPTGSGDFIGAFYTHTNVGSATDTVAMNTTLTNATGVAGTLGAATGLSAAQNFTTDIYRFPPQQFAFQASENHRQFQVNTFSATAALGASAPYTTTVVMTVSSITGLTITGASGTGSVATLTFATNGSPAFIPGTLITVQGMTPSGYNGVYTVTASTATTVSYANATTGFTSGGTVTANIQTGHEVRPNFTSSGTNVFSKTNAALIIQQLTTTNATGYWGLEGTYELTQIYVGQPSGTTWSGSASAYAVTLGSAMAFDQAIKGRSYNGSNRARTLSLQPEAVEFATAGLGINSLWSTYPEHVKLVTTIASNVLTCPLHGLKVGDQVVPAVTAQNLEAGVKYYVRTVPTTSTFTLATTSDLSTQKTGLTDGTLLTTVRLYVYGTGTNTLIFRNFRAGHLHNATINYTPQVSADPLGVINFFGTTAAAQSLASSTFGSASTSPTVGSTALMPALSLAAQISVEAAADWSSGNIPSRIRLRTVAATGTTLRDTMVVDSTKVSVAVPMQLASYTIANKPATGSAGQMISISDSPTYADRMAYWTSTATACWRYVSDDTAV